MAVKKIRWYVKAQLGVLMLPAGLCLFGEAVIRKGLEELIKRTELASGADGALPIKLLQAPGPWFWYGTFGLILINAGVGLMVESGLLRGYPRQG
ncbi:MAG: hypothetical protein MUD04_01225 [Cyanobium sp. Prado107]|jgi:hypothetical protein|nr:hypothetical protein [Cyanobium sp. Prado107]